MENKDGLLGVSLDNVLTEMSRIYFRDDPMLSAVTMEQRDETREAGKSAFHKWLTFRQEMVANGWDRNTVQLNFEGYMKWQAAWQMTTKSNQNRSRWWDGRRPPPPIEIRPVHERKGRARGI